MKNNKALLVALVLSLGLTVFLSVKGCQSNTAEVQDTVPPPQLEHDHDHDHDHNETSEHTDSEVMSLIENNLDREDLTDAELAELFEACDYAHSKSLLSQEQMLKYGKLRIAKSSIPMEMMGGIRVLKDLEKLDSTNVEVLEILGSMSVQSGQWDKAKKRYQKLLSLQPENKAYRQILEQICQELGDSDCF